MGAEASNNSGGTPPFLTKTYEMVDDPSTDEIVSWSESATSFVVWNVADFTKLLLPQYFKHNNFSSFVRQLNTYGFHKIDPERQEFSNEGFSKGNKDALKNIHRRKPCGSHTHSSQKESLPICNDPGHAELEGEIQKLKEDKGILINELVKIQNLHETTEVELETLAQRLQALEERQHRIMTFIGHVLCNPAFMCSENQNETLALSKKRRLPLPDQGIMIGMGESLDDEGRCLGLLCSSGDRDEAISAGRIAHKSEEEAGCETSFDCVVRQLAGSTLNQSAQTSPISGSSETTLWKMHSNIEGNETNADLVGSCAVNSLSESAECSQSECEGADMKADDIDLHVSNETGNELPPDHAHDEDGSDGSKACGSNDVFWESMLTENPCLTEKDLRDCRCEDQSNERWFL